MALRTEEPLMLGQTREQKVGITGGPNDWDLWLCFRGTRPQVDFFTDQVIKSPLLGPQNGGNFFSARITNLRSSIVHQLDRTFSWHIEGIVIKYPHQDIWFEAEYNVQNRNGIACFKWK